MTTFPTPNPIAARVDIEVGDVTVTATAATETVVSVAPADPAREQDRRAAEETRVTCSDGRLDVVGPRNATFIGPTRRSGSVQVTVTLPTGSALEVRTAMGVVAADGSFGPVSVRTSAGDIRLGDAGSADLRSGVGTVAVGRVAGDLRATTGSGSIRIAGVAGQCLVKNANGDTWIGHSGTSTRIKSANGRVDVERAGGDLTATTANGAVRVGCAERGQVQLRTSIGSIELGIPAGTSARLVLRTSFGSVRNHLEPAAGPTDGEGVVEVNAHTAAGDIDVVRSVVDLDAS